VTHLGPEVPLDDPVEEPIEQVDPLVVHVVQGVDVVVPEEIV
jgi:hypothetical protein